MTSCLRFLQCAGFRFDSPFWDGPESWTTFRNQDLWQSFQTLIALCQSEKIEFLFLTGDLFEQEYVRKETVERVAKSLAKLEGTRVFITPGRRDPLIISSAYRLTVWPSNVHIFSSGVTSVRIPSHNVTVYGAGWTAYHQERPFLDSFQPLNDGTLQLMLLHAMVDSKQNTEGFIPIRQEQVSSSGLDYLALGSREVWSGVQQAGKTNWADCGSLEARSFLDNGPHGVLLGEIQKESSRFEFRELGQRCYIEKNLTIQSQSSLEGIAENIIAETSLEERQKNLYRIKLSGNLLDVEELVQPLQNLLMTQFRFVTVLPLEERTEPQLEFPVLSREKSMEGFPTLAKIFINKLQARLINADESESSDYWEIVQKIGLTALGQGRTVDED
ncbi:metallophosphoesterase family protein [Desulfosporosinus nitroreducens]|uniref:metallophosphoesterase family protein n=1 Tax=Desulfosporosinus nitroreducens TaxID=2018668 RepID=UPI00207D5FF8|nr:hypothetical protein [Desulfosporosinus nitroreducens]MCO1602473.1 hypothetical protein [Desulfosporosinus nitroreducens]